jgi:hypothetical protein
MSLKSEMTRLQSEIYASELGDTLGEVLTKIAGLFAVDMELFDRYRLRNLSMVARIKAGWYQGAIEEALTALGETKDRFTLAYAQRAAVVALLAGDESNQSAAAEITNTVEDEIARDQQGVMHALAWRDLGLTETLLHKNKKRGLQNLKQAQAALPWYGHAHSSAIRVCVEWSLNLAEAFLKRGPAVEEEIPAAVQPLFAPLEKIHGPESVARAWRMLPY